MLYREDFLILCFITNEIALIERLEYTLRDGLGAVASVLAYNPARLGSTPTASNKFRSLHRHSPL